MSNNTWMMQNNRFPNLNEFIEKDSEYRKWFLNTIITNNKELRDVLIKKKLNIDSKKYGSEGYMIYYYILVVLLKDYDRLILFASNICPISQIISNIDDIIMTGPIMNDDWKNERDNEFKIFRSPEYKESFTIPYTKITQYPDFSHMEKHHTLFKHLTMSEHELSIVMGLS